MKRGKEWGGDVPEKDPNIRPELQKSFLRVTWGSIKTAILGSFAAVMFGVAILLVSIMAVTDPMSVFPQEIAQEEQNTKVEYYLPYPGVLPDSPLYKLKAARDKIVLWVTWDGEKKARKELLYADKRINAAVFLVEGGKEALGVSTATKAEKYLESSVNRTVELSSKGKDVKSLLGTLVTASSKHVEILIGLQEKSTGERKKVVEDTVKVTRVLRDKAEQALLEAK